MEIYPDEKNFTHIHARLGAPVNMLAVTDDIKPGPISRYVRLVSPENAPGVTVVTLQESIASPVSAEREEKQPDGITLN